MTLSVQCILEELSKNYHIIGYYIQNKDPFIERVLFHTSPSNDQGGTLYICDTSNSEEYGSPSSFCAYIFVGELPDSFPLSHMNYILLESSAPIRKIVNIIQQVFDQLNQWETQVLRTVLAGKGLQSIFDISLTIIQNPIYLHDEKYRILVYSENKEHPVMTQSYDFLSDGKMSTQAILGLSQSPSFDKTFETSNTTYWKKTSIYPDEYNYIYCNIFVNGSFSGRIFVDERVRTFNALDFLIIDKLASIVSMIMKSRELSLSSHINHLEVILRDIFNGHAPSEKFLHKDLINAEWNENDSYLCITLKYIQEKRKHYITDSICGLLESSFPKCCVFQYNSNIVAVINTSSQVITKDYILRKLTPIVFDYKLIACVSLLSKDLRTLKEYYNQTIDLFQLLEKKASANSIYFFADYCLENIFFKLSQQYSHNTLFPPNLFKLIKFDQDNHTNYTETLRAYLENHCSPAQTSKSLYIHRSTFLYRLEKINEIIDSDFTNLSVRIHYQIAFQILDIDASTPNNELKP